MWKLEDLRQFWNFSAEEITEHLGSSPAGLTTAEAKRRLVIYGPNRLHIAKRADAFCVIRDKLDNKFVSGDSK